MTRRFRALISIFLIILLIPFPSALASQSATEDTDIRGTAFEASISELSELLDAGLLTSAELVEFYTERIEVYNSTFNCFITLCENAAEVAAQRDQQRADGQILGALHGIPIVVKDNIDVSGYPTTSGWKYYLDDIADENAAAVQRMLDAGAIIIGKTNMSTGAEYASCSVSEVAGETVNAYNPAYTSGGSSGGSAVAVSLNLAAAGLGTDTNSSLRISAAFNGTVALRSTFGLVDTTGIDVLNSDRDTVGAITRSAEDQAVMLDVLTDGAYLYSDSLNGQALDGAVIGVLSELSGAADEVPYETQYIDEETIRAFNEALAEMRTCGATVVEVSFPALFSYYEDASDDSAWSMDAYYTAMVSFFSENGLDAVVFPACLSATPPGGYLNGEPAAISDPFLNMAKYVSSPTGMPEISFPVGYTTAGLSVGVEMIALKNEEQLLLDLVYSYETAYPHRIPSDVAPNLYSVDHTYISELMREKSETTAKMTVSDAFLDRGEPILLSGAVKPDKKEASVYFGVAMILVAMGLFGAALTLPRRCVHRWGEARQPTKKQ